MSLIISHHTALWMHCSPKFASSAAAANYIEGPINASVTGEKVDRWYRPALSELTGIPLADLGAVDYLLSRDVARHPSPSPDRIPGADPCLTARFSPWEMTST